MSRISPQLSILDIFMHLLYLKVCCMHLVVGLRLWKFEL